jgi:hypothetical protein
VWHNGPKTHEILKWDKVLKITVGATNYCVQLITVSNSLLCPTHYCVQLIIVSKSLLCPTHYCVQVITVSNSLLCPTHYCVQLIIVSKSLLCLTHYCVQLIIVSNSLLCPTHYCVQLIIVWSKNTVYTLAFNIQFVHLVESCFILCILLFQFLVNKFRLVTLPNHLRPPLAFSWVLVSQSLVLCVVF